jgi:threonyl-tRNA synthetase
MWLSPTQVRLIPMSTKYLEHAEKLGKELEKHCIRFDIDDRTMTLQKRVREAEMEWVPYIIVVGQKEAQSETFPVRDRKAGKIRNMKLEKLINEIEKEIEGNPFKPLPLPTYLSKRPQFYG